jgi:hypothetical protein
MQRMRRRWQDLRLITIEYAQFVIADAQKVLCRGRLVVVELIHGSILVACRPTQDRPLAVAAEGSISVTPAEVRLRMRVSTKWHCRRASRTCTPCKCATRLRHVPTGKRMLNSRPESLQIKDWD